VLHDNLLFCRANILEWLRIQEVLDIYERASGQKLNNKKASMFFSCNTHKDTKAHILSVVGVSVSQSFEKYMGLPALVGCSKVRYKRENLGKNKRV
jgi:hypothetical protein